MNTTIKPPLSAPVPRLSGWAVITVLLLVAVWLLAPQQLPVSLYKLSLVTLAAVIGYWLDRSLFPYARPDTFQQFEDAILADDDAIAANNGDPDVLVTIGSSTDVLFAAAMIRRALIVGAAMLAMGLGA